jgi:RNA polymerase sigma factor (sigma-70 family)
MTDLELVEKYGKLCGHIAWTFVARGRKHARDGEQINKDFGTEDAEDLASLALIGLIKCPTSHRHEPPYVKRLIVNHIIKGWHKMCRHKNAEQQTPESRTALDVESQNGINSTTYHDWFDKQEGRDGLAGHTQVKYDSRAVLAILPTLPESERIVMELSFGLIPGCEPLGLERIARKMGRTKYWAEIRLNKGLSRIREELHISQ